MRKIYSLLPLVILFVALIAGIFEFQNRNVIENYNKEGSIQLSLGSAIFDIEIAATKKARQRGLSGRENLVSNTGMLFVFEEPDFHAIWMKDMNFPIDIIWLDDQFIVVDLATNVSSESFPATFKPRLPAWYVLEISAGMAEQYGIKIGDWGATI